MRWLITFSLLASACGSESPVAVPPATTPVSETPSATPTDQRAGAACASDNDCKAPLRCVFNGIGVKGCLDPDVDLPATRPQTTRTGVAGASCRTDADCDAPLRCYAGGAGAMSCRRDVDLSP